MDEKAAFPINSALARVMSTAPPHCYVALDCAGETGELQIVGLGATPSAALEAAKRTGFNNPVIIWSREQVEKVSRAGGS